jgi:isopentenyl-diphosphate delta-isomerase
MELVILVDENDNEMGALEKMDAHINGVLHRAFSVFIFNSKGEMLLQQRSAIKYHSAGLWTNACCSHPRPGEKTSEAAKRRLKEELGFTVSLNHLFAFTYKAEFDNGLIEHEFDHVYTGIYEGPIEIVPEEVQAYSYRSVFEINRELESRPEKFTAWFQLAFPKLLQTDYQRLLRLT